MISDNVLIGIIVLLIGAHYTGMVFELRKIRHDVEKLRSDISNAAIAAANAATAAANAAAALAGSRK